jgi:hypothetical protein
VAPGGRAGGSAARRQRGARAGGRAAWRAAEEDLADNVVELQAARERVALLDGGVVECPFKGLASFDVDDAGVYFGRERLIADMVARLAGAPLLAVVGPSGSGKSSALKAGLLATLAAGALPTARGGARCCCGRARDPCGRSRTRWRRRHRVAS